MSAQSMTLTQKQDMRMNVQLLQTMDIIALSAEELKEKIKKEAETNPTMVVKEATPSFNALSNIYRQSTEKSESYSDSDYSTEQDDRPNWIEGTISQKESLTEHLLNQLGVLNIEDGVKKAAETLITSLDRYGFTGEMPEELLSDNERPYFDEAIKVVQSLDPVGIGALDWKDSLMIQIKAEGAMDSELKMFHKLIYNEMDNIKSGKIAEVAKDLKTDKEDVESMLELIRTLTPFPGLEYSTDYETYITPELSIKKVDGQLKMTLNRDALPSVEVDPTYSQMQQDLKGNNNKEEKEASQYLKEKLQSAQNLINQLEIRASTLERTGAVLMEKQKDFFLSGPLYLKGLTMKEVADEVGVHEATISRVASSKYIDTDFGIFPIRYLFSSKTRNDEGEDVSKNAIKEMIRQIIEGNTSAKALSDQKIATALEEKGIKIARRTVAKYRKELDIDSSFNRMA